MYEYFTTKYSQGKLKTSLIFYDIIQIWKEKGKKAIS